MRTFDCAAILFDLDGVLVDSTGSVDRHWRMWAKERNIDPEKVLEIAHGVRTIEVVRKLAPHLDAAAEVVRIEKREAEDQEGVAVMPGAAELLKAIPEGRWCVVTSGTRHLATSRLKLANLPAPRVLVSADDVCRGKPDPEPYLMGANLLGEVSRRVPGHRRRSSGYSCRPRRRNESDWNHQHLSGVGVAGGGCGCAGINAD